MNRLLLPHLLTAVLIPTILFPFFVASQSFGKIFFPENRDTYLGTRSSEVTAPTATDPLGPAERQSRDIESPPTSETESVVTWTGSRDNRWGNPANWEGRRVPGISDVVRFAAGSNSAVLDAAAPGVVAGLVLESDYRGTVALKRDLTVSNDLVLGGGTLDQGKHSLSIGHFRQTGGVFTGGAGKLTIQRDAILSGGTLLSSRSMIARSLTINSPAVLTMAANSKLNLTGDGEPLTGNGRLDVTTYGPNSLEYTGRAKVDITAAGPIKGALGVAERLSVGLAIPTARLVWCIGF